jgi:hypothetical protein
VKQTEGAAPFEEEERLLQNHIHPFYRFDLTLVVLLCLENFREYFSSVFNSLLCICEIGCIWGFWVRVV